MTENQKPEVRIVSLSKVHTIMWYCLLIWVMITSMIAGHLLSSGGTVLPTFFLLGNLVLGATMATLSRGKK
jgi:hypothetical protein